MIDAAASSAVRAGFWRRYLAYSLDWLLLSPALALLLASPVRRAAQAAGALLADTQQWLLTQLMDASLAVSPLALAETMLRDPALSARLQSGVSVITTAVLQASVYAAALAALYFIGFEASAWAATPGKRLLGLRVEDMAGRRPSLARAAARFFAGALSWLSLNIGHALVGWRADGRALHDLIAGTRVTASGPTPRWAYSVLWLQGLGLLALFVMVLREVAGVTAQL